MGVPIKHPEFFLRGVLSINGLKTGRGKGRSPANGEKITDNPTAKVSPIRKRVFIYRSPLIP